MDTGTIEFPFVRTPRRDSQTLLNSISAFSGSEAKADVYHLIQQEISALQDVIRSYEDQIRQWKTCHNRLSNIFRLPVEILLDIFGFLTHGQPITLPNLPSDIHSATKVCAVWRKVIFDCSSLWRRPYLREVDLAADRKRAYPGPLLVEIDCADKQRWSQWSHWGHINQTDVTGISDRWEITEAISLDHAEEYDNLEPELTATFKKQAPSLETIILYFKDPESHTLPEVLFGHARRLRHIHLQNWNILVNPTPFGPIGAIVTLEICVDEKAGAATQQLTVRELLQALTLFPNLQLLKLDNVLKSLSDEDRAWSAANTTQHVEFPVLRNIDVLAELPSLAVLFKHIKYPPSTVVFGGGYWENGAPSDVTAMVEFTRQTSMLAYNPIHALRLSVRDYPEESLFEAEIMTAPLPAGWIRDKATITVHGPPRTEIMKNVLQAVDLEHLQELALFLSSSHPLDIDWDLIRQLPRLQFLTMGPFTSDFLSALDAHTNEPTLAVDFPCLEALRISRTRLFSKSSRTNEPPTNSFPDQPSFGALCIDDLKRCILRRKNHHKGPYTLSIDQESTQFSLVDIESLKEAFRSIEVL